MFSRLINSNKLFAILCDASGSRKSKMAALKEELLIDQHAYNIVAKILEAKNMYFKVDKFR